MYEIELKAHIENIEKTKTTINTFARFLGTKDKTDVYWQLNGLNPTKPVRVRIRQELSTNTSKEITKSLMVTYKRKELRNTKESIAYEVNEENEFSISNREAFESILIDSGFNIALQKEKKVLQWEYNGVLLELCTITGLGDFLELEIVAENRKDSTIKKAIDSLQSVLQQCGVPIEKIEKRYYSELMQEKGIG